ncbi:MAG: cupin [Proteobacteria bacterium]|nr:cupin [Pseudomonadota bacterium]
MLVRRLSDAKHYEAPNHSDMRAMRLQGFEPGGPDKFWVGLSHFLPAGGAGPDSSPLEKVYVVLAGRLRVTSEGEAAELGPMDSVCIGGNAVREIRNLANEVATMLVIMPYPEKS